MHITSDIVLLIVLKNENSSNFKNPHVPFSSFFLY